ncbi:L-2-hydroxyglutarate dehydrogenase, mitochondrial [Dirofilaria immitis]|nr:L-2-hydroxyglutarate dehydrogenase, mitochondrial [Dirofilaria immitis]
MNVTVFRLLTSSRVSFNFRASILSRSEGKDIASTVSGSIASEFDVVVVGGGIIGCATARQLKISNPELKVALLEKENRLAFHQSGHNSGVLHAGIYYAPGSIKAKLCVRGKILSLPHELVLTYERVSEILTLSTGIDLAYTYCDKHKVPYKKIGKLIVAVESVEVPRLEGLKALWSPYTGIIDWELVTKSYAQDFENRGGIVYTKYPLKTLLFVGESKKENIANNYPIVIESEPSLSKIRCKYVITCCGLQSDHIAKLSGSISDPKIIPFRGEYLLLTSETKKKLVTTNVYPVPDPRLPFLGVHFTPRMNGDVWLGPNAVIGSALSFDIRSSNIYETFSYVQVTLNYVYRGTRKLIIKFFDHGVKELYRGVWIRAQVKQLQRFMPDLKISDVSRGPAGVRAQAVDSMVIWLMILFSIVVKEN